MMAAYKDALLEGRSFDSIKDWATRAGVSVSAARNAFQDDSFMIALRAESTRYIAFQLPQVLKRCIDAAAADSWNDRRAILEMMGIYEPNKGKEKPAHITALITGDDIMRAWDEYRASQLNRPKVRELPASHIETEEDDSDH